MDRSAWIRLEIGEIPASIAQRRFRWRGAPGSIALPGLRSACTRFVIAPTRLRSACTCCVNALTKLRSGCMRLMIAPTTVRIASINGEIGFKHLPSLPDHVVVDGDTALERASRSYVQAICACLERA